MQATTSSPDYYLKALTRLISSRRCSSCMLLFLPVAASYALPHLSAQENTMQFGKRPTGWDIMQVDATNLLGASVRYFGLADNQLTGTLPAYLSASTLPVVSQFSIELQVSEPPLLPCCFHHARARSNMTCCDFATLSSSVGSSSVGCVQGNNFSCPVPKDMAYLNVTCEDKPPAVDSQPSSVDSVSSAPNPSTFQTGNATVENARSQQCVPCWARPCCFPSQIPFINNVSCNM